MSTTVGAGKGFQSGMNHGSLRIWLRLFLEISGAALAIAVALGLLVVLAASATQAQAQALSPELRSGAVSVAPSPAAEERHAAVTPATASGTEPALSSASAALQLATGSSLLGAGFVFLLSRRGSRLLAGGRAAEAA